MWNKPSMPKVGCVQNDAREQYFVSRMSKTAVKVSDSKFLAVIEVMTKHREVTFWEFPNFTRFLPEKCPNFT